jgi:group I intron endonuclease
MAICCALLKHGYSNFSITILEYCEVSELLTREKYYIDLLVSEYNIVKDPTLPPMSGRKHSDATKKIMLGRTHSEETKTKMSDTQKKIYNPGRFKTGNNNPNYGKKVVGSGSPSQQIEVTDIKNNQTTTYDSINEAARALNIHPARIVMYFSRNQKKPYKGQYTLKKI